MIVKGTFVGIPLGRAQTVARGAKFGAKVLNRGLAFFITREFGGKADA